MYLTRQYKTQEVIVFRKTNKQPQVTLFEELSGFLREDQTKRRIYDDPAYWHNQFRKQVYDRINEEPYRVLYSAQMGTPNVSVALLISMMILKELFIWSDAQLFEQAQFNMLVRSALGLFRITDPLPTPSTYYLFRKRLYDYEQATGIDLYRQTFMDLTGKQVQSFQVNGQRIRMDSKLIGSYIASYSRYVLIHKTLQIFYRRLTEKERARIPKKKRHRLETLMVEEAEKVVYHHSREELKDRLRTLGRLIALLLDIFHHHTDKEYQQLDRLFQEQYQIGDGKRITLRSQKEISSSSLQSPHDPECCYRSKGNQQVKGYSVNVTETCSREGLNLITDVQVAKANESDSDFLKEAVQQSVEVTGQRVTQVHTDGGYYSLENADYARERDIDLILTGIQGKEPLYDIRMQADGIWVINRHTGERYRARPVKRQAGNDSMRWYIITSKGRKYFDRRALVAAENRRKLKERSSDELNIRNNVESTIFHLSYGLIKGKTRYRGQQKQKLWALNRAMAVNLVRIVKYVRSKYRDELQIAQNTPPVSSFDPIIRLFFPIIAIIRHRITILQSPSAFQPQLVGAIN